MLPSQRSLRLPKEIIENVIDEATYHTQTLRSFALTCHDFLPRSRYHLFRYLCFRDMTQIRSFYKFLDVYPHIRFFVLSLTLSATPDDPKSLSALQIVPTLLFRKLPNLYIWQISDPETHFHEPCQQPIFGFTPKYDEPRRWLTFSRPTLACLRAHGTAIVELYLNSVSLLNCAHFVEYIMAFQALKFLYCGSVHFINGIDDLRLSRIKKRLSGKIRLSTLIIGRDIPDDAALALLESSPSTLLNLELHVKEDTRLDLPSLVSELRKLRCVTLALQQSHLIPTTSRMDEKAILRTFKIIKALNLHPESHLQTLIIHLRQVEIRTFLRMLSKTDSYSGFECFSELESILLRLPRLRLIEVHHDAPRDIDWTVTLEQYLPTLARQRTVRFKHLPATHRQRAGHDGSVRFLAVSPDSKQIASGSDEQTIILWDAERGSIIHEWIAHLDGILSLAFSPDSQRLASASYDKKVVVWDISGSGVKRIVTLEGHSDKVNSCAWSPDGTVLISGSHDETVRVWDTRTYQQLHSLQDPSVKQVHFVQFSPDGRWIASGGFMTSDCAVWDAATGDLHVVLHGHLRNVVFDLATGRTATASDDHTVRIWDVETGEALVVLRGHTDVALDVAFSPDGRRVASASCDGTVKVWDSFSGDLLLSLEGHTDYVRVVCFSPDGKYIASASWDKTVRLWRASDGACIRTFTEHTGRICDLVYSPDGETLTSGGFDGNVCIRRVCDIMLEEDSGGDGPVQSK